MCLIRGMPAHLREEFARRVCPPHGAAIVRSSGAALVACCDGAATAIEGELDFLRAVEEIADQRVEEYRLTTLADSDEPHVSIRLPGRSHRSGVVPRTDWDYVEGRLSSARDERARIAREFLQRAV